ncbi:hypothetical protein BHE90_010155 [Fusarium euwallaceae]|uniref:Aminoglycoside phosphotransferase domain-containing protein n=1 Tax=Fusarium euwallaceae TaxID=1147111 RepID=A0A430LI40_9HYPO|nr:hypothetical protein BHE90_010155 [Fusarium euwallaceae]
MPRESFVARSGIVQHLDSREWTQRGREATDDQLSQAEPLSASKYSKKKVLKIDSKTVVKLAPDLDMTEVDNLVFIRSRTTIPVPKILNAYEKDGCQYVVMEFLEGEKLESAWPKLSVEDRESICSELHEYLGQMRNIPAPKALIGSVSGGPAVDRRSLGALKGGPFACEEEFNKWQLEQLRDNTPLLNQDMYAAMHRTDHKIVFSHGDLGFHNIMIRDGHITAILDWEYAGWYPEHWDFCKSLQFLAGTDEHYQFGKKAFGKTYLGEFYMDTWFTREVKHGGW